DMWLIPMRDNFPQVGATSLEDSDYVIVRVWQPLSWFKENKNNKKFKNMAKAIELLKDKPGDKQTRDSGTATTQREDNEYPSKAQEAKGKGYYEILCQYEKDHWTYFGTAA